MYWSALPVRANPTTIVNNVPFLLPRQFPEAHECKAVQATAFALMVYIQNNYFADSRPIMRWLQTMRNFNGGFSASQVRLGTLTFVVMCGGTVAGGSGFQARELGIVSCAACPTFQRG